jgi:hypothetical protein
MLYYAPSDSFFFFVFQYIRVFGFEVEKTVYRTIIQSILTSSDSSHLIPVYQELGQIFSKPNFVSLLRHSLLAESAGLPDPREVDQLVSGTVSVSQADGASGQHQQELVKSIDALSRILCFSQSEKLAAVLSLGIDPEPLISCGDISVGKCQSGSPEFDHFLLNSLSLNPNHSSIRSQLQEAICSSGKSHSFPCLLLNHCR